MEPLRIDPTLDTPKIIFDIAISKLEISGKSFPADVVLFYQPVNNWVDKYLKTPQKQSILELKLDYFNTASSKVLLDILYKFEELQNSGNQVKIKWYYPDDDEEMQETGVEYAKLVGVPFEHISYSVQFK